MLGSWGTGAADPPGASHIRPLLLPSPPHFFLLLSLFLNLHWNIRQIVSSTMLLSRWSEPLSSQWLQEISSMEADGEEGVGETIKHHME